MLNALKNEEISPKREMLLNEVETSTLAFIGDGLWDLFVRNRLFEEDIHKDSEILHRQTIMYVNAKSQCRVMKRLISKLSEKEERLVKRTRNRRVNTKAKNVDIITYKWATAFEALLGWLYLSGNEDRCVQVMEEALVIIRDRKS